MRVTSCLGRMDVNWLRGPVKTDLLSIHLHIVRHMNSQVIHRSFVWEVNRLRIADIFVGQFFLSVLHFSQIAGRSIMSVCL